MWYQVLEACWKGFLTLSLCDHNSDSDTFLSDFPASMFSVSVFVTSSALQLEAAVHEL